MTTFVMCSVRDVVSSTYGRPFSAPNRPAAVRSFSVEVNDERSGMLHTHPADFDLYLVGEFDDDSGLLAVVHPPVLLGKGTDLVSRPVES